MLQRSTIAGAMAFALLGIGSAAASFAATPLKTELVTDGLDRPLFVTHAPNDQRRIFIVEQTGKIRIYFTREQLLQHPPFLNLASKIECCGERGLLGLAFHPDYIDNGYFYVNYTNTAGNTVIERYRVANEPRSSNFASILTAFPILEIPQNAVNHNGGWIGFGPDGYLYIATGDGGNSCDPNQQAQDTTDQLLGKLLRIDVDGGTPYAIPADNPFVGDIGDDEIWAYGLRNPYRCAFDEKTGDLYIADVGEKQVEEINIQLASSGGGENYGWDCMEGSACSSVSGCASSGCACNDPGLVLPVHDYTHADGFSVTGGEVYRGCQISDLDGSYFFGDFGSARIWSFDGGVAVQNFTERTAELAPGEGLNIATISSFGVDAFGEIYICDWNDGEVFKIVPDREGPETDCNANGVEDACDIRGRTSTDFDRNGIPDDCVPALAPALSRDGLVLAILCMFAAGVWTTLRPLRRA